MAARLIINADDFGLTSGVNRAIGELYAAAALTSATLMANGAALNDALSVARANPGLGIGCHIVYVDGTPLSAPSLIPSLMATDGTRLRSSIVDFTCAVLRCDIRESDLVHEGVAQVSRLQQAGVTITHLDTHKHTHMLPLVTRSLLRIAEDCGVRALRNPFEPSWTRSVGKPGLLRKLAVMVLDATLRSSFVAMVRDTAIRTTNGTIGVSATGNLNGSTLPEVLEAIPSWGTWELVVHPGYNDQDLDAIETRLRESRDIERLALTNSIRHSQPLSADLINFSNI